MTRRKDPSEGNPRTGDGRVAKGKKPTETGVMRMMSVHAEGDVSIRREQPKGWGVARVIDILTGKERGR